MIVIVVVAALGTFACGVALGCLLISRRTTHHVVMAKQTCRVREEEIRTLRLQLQGLRRAYETGTLTVENSATASQARVSALLEEVRSMVAPLANRMDRREALTHLPRRFVHRGHLCALLSEIGERADLGTVVLSDAIGLPIAAAGADDGPNAAETLAATSAMVLSLATRLEESGQPSLLGAVIRDADRRSVIHRPFDVAGEWFVVTGVSDSATVAPDIFDPTLRQLRQILRQPTVAAV